jgi:hypothetical protein
MILRKYKTNWRVRVVVSAAVFTAIGAAMRVPIKGQNVLIAPRLVEITSDFFSGQEELRSFIFVMLYVTIWVLVSGIVGWLIQSLLVIWVLPKSEKSKSLD